MYIHVAVSPFTQDTLDPRNIGAPVAPVLPLNESSAKKNKKKTKYPLSAQYRCLLARRQWRVALATESQKSVPYYIYYLHLLSQNRGLK